MKKEELTPGTKVLYTSPINGVMVILTIAVGLLSDTWVSVEERDKPVEVSALEELTPASFMKARSQPGYAVSEKEMQAIRNFWNNRKLSVFELANALYEGTPALQNLAEKLARQHGNAQALTFFGMMGEDIQNFYMGIAQQLIDHAKEWKPNSGSACMLSEAEIARLKALPRHPELINKPKTPFV